MTMIDRGEPHGLSGTRFSMKEETKMLDVESGLIPTTRAVVDVNRPCNAKCVMCYYSYDDSNWTKTLNQISLELASAKSRGNLSVDFTGGEPTIHPEMDKVILEAEGMGLHTCVITNGLAREKVKKLTEAGCSEWLVSVHGFEAQHDRLLGVPGAWKKVNDTIQELNGRGSFVRINCTLTRYNAKDLPKLAKHYVSEFQPRIVNFINFNPHYEWGNSDQPEVYKRLNEVQINGSEVAPYLKEAIDILASHNTWVNVRYFPFCLLRGYETYICNNPQVMFDPYEWDYGVMPKSSEVYLKYGRELQSRIGSSEGACGECGILDVCGGIHVNYARLHGYRELTPYRDERSDYPYYFKTDLTTDIVVPAFKPNGNLQKLLEEIAAKTAPPYNLVVVSKQQSAARNRNAGLMSSRSPFVIMCDDDICDLPHGWNRALLQKLKENPDLLAVSARLMNPNGTIGRNSANNGNMGPDLVKVGMIPTACCVLRRSDVRFDEGYITAGWEDTDFFMQMMQRFRGGFAIANTVKVVHLNEEKNNGGAQNLHNQQRFMRKWEQQAADKTSPPPPVSKGDLAFDLPADVARTVDQGDFDEACRLLRANAGGRSIRAGHFLALGLAGRRLGHNEQALRCFYQAATLEPANIDILKQFIQCSEEVGNYQTLEAFLRMVSIQRPEIKEFSLLLAECLFRQNKLVEAQKVLRAILAKDPGMRQAAELAREVDDRLCGARTSSTAPKTSGPVTAATPAELDLKVFNNLTYMTKRGCIDVGHICDINCLFCYHRFEDRKTRRFLSKQSIMDRLKRDRESYDLTVTDFTGGEPTLHPDIVEIVAFGNRIGNRICLITHGQWKHHDRIEAIIDAGVQEFLVSIHGVQEDHDAATNPGAFARIMTSIELMEKKGARWRVNCVAHKRNMTRLPQYARMIGSLSHRPYNANFIVFSPLAGWHQQEEIDFQAKHSELGPNLSEAIDIFSAANIWTNVRYYPMCMLPDREQHVTCFPQICYDPFEWDYRSYANPEADMIRKVYEIGVSNGVHGETPYHRFHNTWSIIQSQKLYRKGQACMDCRLRLICDGVAEQYERRFGLDELITRPGELVKDPIHFRRHWPAAVGN